MSRQHVRNWEGKSAIKKMFKSVRHERGIIIVREFISLFSGRGLKKQARTSHSLKKKFSFHFLSPTVQCVSLSKRGDFFLLTTKEDQRTASLPVKFPLLAKTCSSKHTHKVNSFRKEEHKKQTNNKKK